MRGEFSCLEACCQAGCLGKPLEKVHQPFFWRAKHSAAPWALSCLRGSTRATKRDSRHGPENSWPSAMARLRPRSALPRLRCKTSVAGLTAQATHP